MNQDIILKDLVLIGGGHSHVHVIKMFGMKPLQSVRITLVTRDINSPYSGMLPGHIAGYYSHEECHIDMNKLCKFANVRLIHAEVNGIDIHNKEISCSDNRPKLKYDILSIDIGISPKILSGNLKNQSNITPVKPIDKFSLKWNEILQRILSRNLYKPINITIIGGGGGGVELAFAIYHRLKNELNKANVDSSLVAVTIINRGESLMNTHNKNVQNIITRLCNEKGIKIVLNTEIIDVIFKSESNITKSYLISSNNQSFEFDEAIWCTEAIGQSWILNTGLQTTEEGFIHVNSTLESTNTKNVFASGDIAHLVDSPRPKAGVFAVRAGPPLFENLRRRCLNETLENWIPQQQFLGIIGTGDNYAVASKGPLGLEGEFLWKLKDRIDKKFMANYQILPDIETMMKEKAKEKQETIPEIAHSMDSTVINLLNNASMRCGGCGSKVGSQVLNRVLKYIKTHYSISRPEIISSSGDDAGLVLPPNSDNYMVHTIDYFKCNLSDPFIFGQIAATHALSDIFAMNAEPVSALALCVLPYGLDEKVEETLKHMLAGAMKVLIQENCVLIGGHTSEGSDLSMGLSVNGVVNKLCVLPKGPLIDGYVLILTKAIGTGVLGAADMRGKASGNSILGSIKSMLQSNRLAAKIFHDNNAKACTDITGFGLVGHLLEMLLYNNSDDDIINTLAVELFINDIPLLEGAIECVEKGILSSLQPQNIRSARAIGNITEWKNNKLFPLLFDPQTSGGLLACVPVDRVENTIRTLHDNGYKQSKVIGRVVSKNILFPDNQLQHEETNYDYLIKLS